MIADYFKSPCQFCTSFVKKGYTGRIVAKTFDEKGTEVRPVYPLGEIRAAIRSTYPFFNN